MILAEALLGAETGQGVSYSRRKVYYSGGKRYRSRAYTYATVLASVAELVQNGWLFEHRVERLAIVVLGDAGTDPGGASVLCRVDVSGTRTYPNEGHGGQPSRLPRHRPDLAAPSRVGADQRLPQWPAHRNPGGGVSRPTPLHLRKRSTSSTEFERGIIRERINAGLASAKANGTKLGRRRVNPAVEARILELKASDDGILKIGGSSVLARAWCSGFSSDSRCHLNRMLAVDTASAQAGAKW
jgi:hypothetical protein